MQQVWFLRPPAANSAKMSKRMFYFDIVAVFLEQMVTRKNVWNSSHPCSEVESEVIPRTESEACQGRQIQMVEVTVMANR